MFGCLTAGLNSVKYQVEVADIRDGSCNGPFACVPIPFQEYVVRTRRPTAAVCESSVVRRYLRAGLTGGRRYSFRAEKRLHEVRRRDAYTRENLDCADLCSSGISVLGHSS